MHICVCGGGEAIFPSHCVISEKYHFIPFLYFILQYVGYDDVIIMNNFNIMMIIVFFFVLMIIT